MRRRLNFQSGFTLVELMIVVVIIGILVVIALPNFIAMQERPKLAALKYNMRSLQGAMEEFSRLNSALYPTQRSEIIPHVYPGLTNRWTKKLQEFVMREGAPSDTARLPRGLIAIYYPPRLEIEGRSIDEWNTYTICGADGSGQLIPLRLTRGYGSDPSLGANSNDGLE